MYIYYIYMCIYILYILKCIRINGQPLTQYFHYIHTPYTSALPYPVCLICLIINYSTLLKTTFHYFTLLSHALLFAIPYPTLPYTLPNLALLTLYPYSLTNCFCHCYSLICRPNHWKLCRN